MNSAPHVRHCIDLIRQSLICRPDTTVEVKDEKVGGVTGFGTEHVCWDWGELVGWTGKWEGWGDDGEGSEGGMEGMGLEEGLAGWMAGHDHEHAR